jgi:osmoprotectant transport system substrate-binding protein
VLAEIYAQALEARGIRVERRPGIGPRELVEPALERGLVELVPEYAGSLLGFLAGSPPSSGLVATRSQLRVQLDARGLVALRSAPAQDQNGFAVTADTAEALGLETLSDLSGRAGLVLGGPPECPERPLCQLGLEEVYGIEFASFVPLDRSGPLTSDALTRGVVDVALVFTTSAEVVRHDLVVLADDRGLQPAEHITPVVRIDTLQRFGSELSMIVDAASSALTTAALRALNAEVEIGGRPAADVAAEWLAEQGLGPGGG